MSQLIKFIKAGFLSSLISSMAFCAHAYSRGYPDGGYSLGVNAGYSQLPHPSGASKKSGVPFTLSVSFGYLWELSNFSTYLGYELQGNYYGSRSFNINNSTVRANLFQVNLLFSAYQYLNPLWNIHGKIGAAYQIDALSGSGNTKSVSGAAPVVSLGVGYRIADDQTLSLDYSYTYGKTGEVFQIKKDIAQINAITLGWKYYF